MFLPLKKPDYDEHVSLKAPMICKICILTKISRTEYNVIFNYLQALSQGLRNKIKTLQKESAMDVYPFVKKVSKKIITTKTI